MKNHIVMTSMTAQVLGLPISDRRAEFAKDAKVDALHRCITHAWDSVGSQMSCLLWTAFKIGAL